MNAVSSISRLLYALLAICLLVGCGTDNTAAQGADSVGEARSAITGGGLVSTTRAPYSSAVRIGNCSGTKLTGNWYLTAQHCGFAAGARVTVTNALDPASGPVYQSVVVEAVEHPTNFYLPHGYRYDLAMVRLTDPNPIPGWAPRYMSQIDTGGGRGVGYGCDFAPGSTNSGKKQYADFATVAFPDQNNNMYLFVANGDPSLCSGDSGGPFFRILSGTYNLTGVAESPNSAWTRVSPARQWIGAVSSGVQGFNNFSEGLAGTFLSKASNWCAEFANNGILSQLWCRIADEPEQQFVVHAVETGVYEFHWYRDYSKCLAVQDGSAAVTVLPCDGSFKQQWTENFIAGQTDFRYRAIVNMSTGFCMRAPLDTVLGDPIVQATCTNTPEFYWVFTF